MNFNKSVGLCMNYYGTLGVGGTCALAFLFYPAGELFLFQTRPLFGAKKIKNLIETIKIKRIEHETNVAPQTRLLSENKK